MKNIRKYKDTIVVILLVAASILAGVDMWYYLIEHVWLMLLMIFCLVGALAAERRL